MQRAFRERRGTPARQLVDVGIDWPGWIREVDTRVRVGRDEAERVDIHVQDQEDETKKLNAVIADQTRQLATEVTVCFSTNQAALSTANTDFAREERNATVQRGELTKTNADLATARTKGQSDTGLLAQAARQQTWIDNYDAKAVTAKQRALEAERSIEGCRKYQRSSEGYVADARRRLAEIQNEIADVGKDRTREKFYLDFWKTERAWLDASGLAVAARPSNVTPSP